MIVLDTHIRVWWVHGDTHLSARQSKWLDESEAQGLGVSAVSCWEVAKLVERKRLVLPCPVVEWFEQALAYPGIELLDLTLRIAVESTQQPDGFHSDPADQLIVATTRVYDTALLTADSKILAYPHVKTLK